MGGVNTWTPIRPFRPTYVNSPLLSDDVDEIRAHYHLNCGGMYCHVQPLFVNRLTLCVNMINDH